MKLQISSFRKVCGFSLCLMALAAYANCYSNGTEFCVRAILDEETTTNQTTGETTRDTPLSDCVYNKTSSLDAVAQQEEGHQYQQGYTEVIPDTTNCAVDMLRTVRDSEGNVITSDVVPGGWEETCTGNITDDLSEGCVFEIAQV